jgi:uncharacterized damage-inducible protein DinB
MPESDPFLIELIRYNNWANRQVLEACQGLNTDQLAASEPGAYGTIRDTLEHIIKSEAWYVNLLTRSHPQPPFKWDDKPGPSEMAGFAAQVSNALLDAAGRVSPEDRVEEEDNGKIWTYNAMAVFIQIVNHGVEHRTNITTILNQGGLKPPAVDGWGYLASHENRFDVKPGE